VDDFREQRFRGAGDLEIGKRLQELAEHDRDLAARQVGAQAVVGAGAAEARVLVRCASRRSETVLRRQRRRDWPSCTGALPFQLLFHILQVSGRLSIDYAQPLTLATLLVMTIILSGLSHQHLEIPMQDKINAW
jgi:hypothetical protein